MAILIQAGIIKILSSCKTLNFFAALWSDNTSYKMRRQLFQPSHECIRK